MKFFSPFFWGKKRRLEEIAAAKKILTASQKDLAFVTRFNDEYFFKELDLSPFYNNRLDFSEKTVLTAFTALYAMTFKGLSFEDIYRIDEVFAFSEAGIRSKDDARRQAAEELAELLIHNDIDKLSQAVQKMGERLWGIGLPPVDEKKPVFNAKNYENYVAAAALGKAYIVAKKNNLELTEAMRKNMGEDFEKTEKRAKLLCDYKYAADYCLEIQTLGERGCADYTAAYSYKEVKKLAEEVNGKM